MSTKKSLTPGDTVNTQCASCGAVKEHKVIALIDEETFRVGCSTCDSEQDFEKTASRPRGRTPAVKTAKPAKPRRSKADTAIAEAKEWQTLRPNMNIDRAVDYHLDGRYQTKALLKHSTFGIGLVTRIAGPQKVEVLFESGKKLLRCH